MKQIALLKKGTIKRVHVDRRIIAQNRKNGTNEPTMTVQTSRGPIKGRRVTIYGHMVFDQEAKQLSCGARIYGETYAEIKVEA